MLRKLWIEIRSSLWFVPGVLMLVGIALALVLVEIDVIFAQQLRSQSWTPWLNAGAEGARGMLTAIASSMITVAGVAFSITIVTLSLASTQYTPRILRNFMRHRANQYVLGIFVAIFTYCLIVLRTIRGGAEQNGGGFVPLLAVAFALALALLSIGCLIFFIHHTATSIQASSILKSITDETLRAIDALFPEEIGEGENVARVAPDLREMAWQSVAAQSSGYLQHVSADGLLRWASEHETVLRVEPQPGDFVGEGTPLASTARALKDEEHSSLRALFVVGEFRTVEQDAGFGIRQIVDIAMKALSPGVNDTSTAVSCVDYLGVILTRLARRRFPSPYREDEGELRVIAPSPDFAGFAAKCFDEIRLSAASNVTILLQLLRTVRSVARTGRDPGVRETLVEHARRVAELAHRTVPARCDRESIDFELTAAREALNATPAALPPLPAEPEGAPQS